MAAFEDMVLYIKAFMCGLCGTQYAMTSASPIKQTPPCPNCEAVTTGTTEVLLPAGQ